jgi:hypothetical protein
MGKKGFLWIFIAAAAALAVFCVSLSNRVASLQNELNDTRRQVSDLSAYYQSSIQQAKTELQSLITEQNRNFFNESIQVVGVNGETVEAEVRFSLKEYEPGVQVSVYTGGGETEKQADRLGDGSFVCRLGIPLASESAISYGMMRGSTLFSESLGSMMPQQSLESRFKYEGFLQPKENKTMLILNVVNVTNGSDQLRLVSCQARVLSDGGVYASFDIMPYLTYDEKNGVESAQIPALNNKQVTIIAAGDSQAAAEYSIDSPLVIDASAETAKGMSVEITAQDALGVNYTFKVQ